MKNNKILYYAGFFLIAALFILKLAKFFIKEKLEDIPFSKYMFSAIFALLGVFIIIAVRGQYDYFVEDKKYIFFRKILGENWVKIFYHLLGLLFVLIGYLFLR